MNVNFESELLKRESMEGTVMGKRKLLSVVLVVALCLSVAPMSAAAAGQPWIGATGAAVLDYDTGEFYFEKNADVARPAASMTKIMSVYLVFEEIEAGRLTLDSYVKASAHASAVSNNPNHSGLENLRTGQSYRVDALLRLVMTASCNGSMIALAEHIGGGSEAAFVERMNAKAVEMGIDAHYADCCGIYDNGNAVTPRAMALLAQRIIQDYPQILEYSSLTSTVFQGKTFNSTNLLLRNGTVPGMDGLKTGNTGGAGYCFTGTAKQDGRRVIAVVMNTTSYAARMSENKTLLEYGFARRAEREAQWSEEGTRLQLNLSAGMGTLYPYVSTPLTVTVSGLSDGLNFPCAAIEWTVNGVPVEVAQSEYLTNGQVFDLGAHTADGSGEGLRVHLKATLLNGTVLEKDGLLPFAWGNISFAGHLGLRRVELYPEASVIVPCQIACDQGLDLTVPAGWYMDGQPIANYQNGTFHLAPQGTSMYTIQASALTPGEHVLEFRCNTAGLPRLDQTALRCEVCVLPDAA